VISSQSRESEELLKPLDDFNAITALWNGFRRHNVPSELQDGLAVFLMAPLELINNVTLRELDITLLVHHVPFRVDLNFHADLQLRPIGRAGGEKSRMMSDYREALTIEMELIRFIPIGVDQEAQESGLTLAMATKVCQRRLPLLLQSVRAMVAQMIPDGDISELEANWDAAHIMQEIHGSVLDFLAKATWLGGLLKKHCAPCRDKDIDRMIETISAGDISGIANGLIELLRVIELMRLDISNYQIRSLRPFFIDSSLQFQQRFYGSQILRRKFDPFKSRTWYVQSRQELEKTPTAASDLLDLPSKNVDLKAFVYGFVQLVLPSCRTAMPATFERDAVRMQAIRSELLGVVQLMICYQVFVEFLTQEHSRSGKVVVLTRRDRAAIRANLRTISHKDGGTIAAMPNLAVEIVRQIAAVGAGPGRQPGSMDLGLLQEVERELSIRLHPNDCHFDREEREVRRQLTVDVFGVAESFLHTLPFEIFTSLVPDARPPPHGGATTMRQSVSPGPGPSTASSPVAAAAAAATRRQQRHGKRATAAAAAAAAAASSGTPVIETPQLDQLDAVRDRLAHIAILHWRVWADLVYLNGGLDEMMAAPPPPPPPPRPMLPGVDTDTDPGWDGKFQTPPPPPPPPPPLLADVDAYTGPDPDWDGKFQTPPPMLPWTPTPGTTTGTTTPGTTTGMMTPAGTTTGTTTPGTRTGTTTPGSDDDGHELQSPGPPPSTPRSRTPVVAAAAREPNALRGVAVVAMMAAREQGGIDDDGVGVEDDEDDDEEPVGLSTSAAYGNCCQEWGGGRRRSSAASSSAPPPSQREG
jgi:hypothetical protein